MVGVAVMFARYITTIKVGRDLVRIKIVTESISFCPWRYRLFILAGFVFHLQVRPCIHWDCSATFLQQVDKYRDINKTFCLVLHSHQQVTSGKFRCRYRTQSEAVFFKIIVKSSRLTLRGQHSIGFTKAVCKSL